MKYTPSQALEITGLSRETLRYWRNTLPSLEGKKGKAARYSAGDLLALLVINEIVTSFDMNIAVIAPISHQIFSACQGVKWHRISEKKLVINIRENKVSSLSTKDIPVSSNSPIILLDMELLFDKLKDLLIGDEAVQFALPFNPVLIKSTN